MKKKRNKKEKVAFWKKLSPEWDRVSGHIGNVIDNGHAVDYFLNGSLAILGVAATNDIRGALIGPIGLRLAQGGNVLAGGVGLAILGSLGVVSVAPGVIDIFDPATPQKILPPTQGYTPEEPNAGCPSGKTKMINFGSLMCVPDDLVGDFQHRGWEKYSDYIARTT